MYSPASSLTVYCQSCWWSDKWDPIHYGSEYNFNQPFFEQLKKIFQEIPIPTLWGFNNINCDYANYIAYNKNVYLSSSITDCEDIYYSTSLDKSLSCFDCDFLIDSQFCYENINSAKNFQSLFLVNSRECINSAFLFDCHNCQNCFMSSNLRNKHYVFRNKQCSKEEYLQKIKEINFGSFVFTKGLLEEFYNLKQKSLHKFANIIRSSNVTGDDVYESKNAKYCFKVRDVEDIKYCWRIPNKFRDAYDVSGAMGSELVYEGSVAANYNYMVKFYSQYKDSKYSDYCILGSNSSNLFGCIGLRNKQYCILNKQYTKEEYERLVPKIIEHINSMPYIDKKGRVYKYGEFFPPELLPFAYNETIAQEYFPLSKEEALKQGYSWKDPEERDIKPDIKIEDLPDHIKDVDDSVIGKVIQCSHTKIKEDSTLEATCNEQCTTAFKIIEPELQFYRRMNLPLPRLCPNCRHYQRLKQRNPLKLWHRKCQCAGTQSENGVYKNTTQHFHGSEPCPNEFETSYASDRPEIVYCEKCYNSEVV
jgi:hypothetical protein